MTYADIILPIAFDSFTYLVPDDMAPQVMRGCRVVVPLGKNKIYTGVVHSVHHACPQGVEVKSIIDVLDETPVVTETQLQFWQWVAQYYICPLGDVMKCALPAAMKPQDDEALKEKSRKRRGSAVLAPASQLAQINNLNPYQAKAMEDIEQSFVDKDITLLHGVTSSGKTEIYIHLIDKYIKMGKQVLYLLPEIALTTQIMDRLHRFFGDAMGVYHSKFSDVQRLDVYKRQVSSNPYQLILSARSGLFLPFSNLGLVIVDEEHEQSYKQQEPAPRYNARNAAIMLAHMSGAKTLLGTATPSFEVYHLARKGRYGYVKLTQRHRDMQLPTIEVVDIKEAKRKKLMKGPFSPRLMEAIAGALSRHEQVILFQNRRGFSSFIECKTCGWVPRCPHCDVTLTLHKKQGTLVCHYCGHTVRIPDKCPACEENHFMDVGIGTEKVEENISQLFEGAKTLRMDLDTATTRKRYEDIINAFAHHEADILIGTQMVTKGLDFDNVSVVGILNADTMLNIPDFRSYEHAFQTLSQVAGRAGRSKGQGLVILQTRSADNPVIAHITGNDYWHMFYEQMQERQLFHYPPFYRLIYVYMKHRDDKLLDHLAEDMSHRLRAVFGERVLGPDRPPVARIQSLYIRKMMIKIELEASVVQVREALVAVQQQMLATPAARNLHIYYDVDPL